MEARSQAESMFFVTCCLLQRAYLLKLSDAWLKMFGVRLTSVTVLVLQMFQLLNAAFCSPVGVEGEGSDRFIDGMRDRGQGCLTKNTARATEVPIANILLICIIHLSMRAEMHAFERLHGHPEWPLLPVSTSLAQNALTRGIEKKHTNYHPLSCPLTFCRYVRGRSRISCPENLAWRAVLPASVLFPPTAARLIIS